MPCLQTTILCAVMPIKSACDEEKRENKSKGEKAKMADPKIFPKIFGLFFGPRSHARGIEKHPVMQGVASADMHMQLVDRQRIASIQSGKRPHHLRNTHTHRENFGKRAQCAHFPAPFRGCSETFSLPW